MQEHTRLSLAQYRAIAEAPENADKRFELIDGEIVEVSPNFITSVIAINIATALKIYIKSNNLGHVTGADGGYELPNGDKYNPDVGFILHERLKIIPEGEVPMMPDLAVEVILPSDLKNKRRIEHKLKTYLELKVPLVWYVYPNRREVEVYTAGDHTAMHDENDILDGGDLLPGFTLSIREILL